MRLQALQFYNNSKNSWPHEITDVTGVTVLIQKEHWKDHGRLFEVHISKHSL